MQDRLALIKRNTAEIITENELKKLLSSKKKPTVYLGTAITGRPHIAYFSWVLKLADFLNAGFKVKLLLADLHGALDNCPWDLLEKRYTYYATIIPLMFKAIGADVKNFEIVKGSDFQMSKKYYFDVLKFSTISNIKDSIRASAEVVKQSSNPKLSGALYPIMQALDEEYLNVDVQYGGVDQRKILVFAREFLPKLGYKRRIEVMTPILPGLLGKKMSASDVKSKIDLLDDEKMVLSKIKSAHMTEGIVKDNGILAFLKYVIMVIKEDNKDSFIVERPEKFGGNITFKDYASIEKAYTTKKLHPLDLKKAVAKEINVLLTPIQKQREKLLKISKEAYS